MFWSPRASERPALLFPSVLSISSHKKHACSKSLVMLGKINRKSLAQMECLHCNKMAHNSLPQRRHSYLCHKGSRCSCQKGARILMRKKGMLSCLLLPENGLHVKQGSTNLSVFDKIEPPRPEIEVNEIQRYI
jgi:hypothetical protein